MGVSVVVPVWNEAGQIASNLARLIDDLSVAAAEPFEIVVVDDGSTDGTWSEACRFAFALDNVRVVHHPRNRGVAAAIVTGATASTGDVVVVLDADLSYEPSHVWRLVAAQRSTRAPIVVASPYMDGGSIRGVPFERRVMSRVANAALSLADRHRSRTYTGMVRAYERTALLRLLGRHVDGLTNERILLEARRAKLRVVEIAGDLCWPDERKRGRLAARRIAARIASVFACGAGFAVTR